MAANENDLMVIHMADDTPFECDLAIEGQNPDRLYLHIINSVIAAVATAFTTELPVQEYPAYTVFDSMNMTPLGGINVCLKKA